MTNDKSKNDSTIIVTACQADFIENSPFFSSLFSWQTDIDLALLRLLPTLAFIGFAISAYHHSCWLFLTVPNVLGLLFTATLQLAACLQNLLEFDREVPGELPSFNLLAAILLSAINVVVFTTLGTGFAVLCGQRSGCSTADGCCECLRQLLHCRGYCWPSVYGEGQPVHPMQPVKPGSRRPSLQTSLLPANDCVGESEVVVEVHADGAPDDETGRVHDAYDIRECSVACFRQLCSCEAWSLRSSRASVAPDHVLHENDELKLPVRFVVSVWLSALVVVVLALLVILALALYGCRLREWVANAETQLAEGRGLIEALLPLGETRDYVIGAVQWLQDGVRTLDRNLWSAIPSVVSGLALGLLNEIMWKAVAVRRLRAALPGAIAAAVARAGGPEQAASEAAGGAPTDWERFDFNWGFD